MESSHKDLLLKKRMELTEQIGSSLPYLALYMSAKRIISIKMKEFILVGEPRAEKVNRLLDLISVRGPKAFHTFYEAVCFCQLWGAADILNPDKAPHGIYAGAGAPRRNVYSDYSSFGLPEDLSSDEEEFEEKELRQRKIDSYLNVDTWLVSHQSDKCTQTCSSTLEFPLQEKTVFETPWQVSETFTECGGIMQSQNSDVLLHVPPGGISSDVYVKIQGAVFTDIEKALEKFDIPEDEKLITPLVEYHASGNYHFSHHSKISLPHFMPQNVDSECVKLYVFSVDKCRQVSLQTVNASDGSENECFWKFGDKKIQIFTTHFSGYFCTLCKKTLREMTVPFLFAKLFGSYVVGRSNRREMRLILYIWDNRLNIKDYLQEKCEIVCDDNFKSLDANSIQLPENTTSKSQIITKMYMADEESQIGWNHVLKPGTSRLMFQPIQVKNLLQAIDCCIPTDPLRFEWVLENSSNVEITSLPRLCIDVGCMSEPTRNFEKALQDAEDNSLLTLYVQNMKLNETSSEVKRYISDNNNQQENSARNIYHPKTVFLDRNTASGPLDSSNTQFNTFNTLDTSSMEQRERTRRGILFEENPSLPEENLSSLKQTNLFPSMLFTGNRSTPPLKRTENNSPMGSNYIRSSSGYNSQCHILDYHNPLERISEKESCDEETFKKEPTGGPLQGFPEIQEQKLNSQSGPAALPVHPTDKTLTSRERKQNNLSGHQCDKDQTIPKTFFMENFGE